MTTCCCIFVDCRLVLTPKLCIQQSHKFYKYPYSHDCHWLISSNNVHTRIKVQLYIFGIGLTQGDLLEFRDGKNENATLIQRFNSTSRHHIGHPVTSSGKVMYMVYKSDSISSGDAFHIWYHSDIIPQQKGNRYLKSL